MRSINRSSTKYEIRTPDRRGGVRRPYLLNKN